MTAGVPSDIALAHAMVQRPGAYALLVGSGVSRAAGIPTGWEVTLELCRRLAVLEDAEDVADPEEWYRQEKGAEPSYSDLVEGLAPNPADQQALLSSFFEPTAEERDRDEKVPTEAHRAIARLAASGHVRIILTTNFDRLLEDALTAEGVQPTVVSSPDGLAGMEPLHQARCVVVKLHGDYKDVRIRNSESALSAYEEPTDRLLDQVLDEYGLVIAGWSGDWDHALRAAILRARSRRYATVWVARGQAAPSEKASELIAARAGEIVNALGADEFFRELESRVTALTEAAAPSPLTVAMAVAETKRALGDPDRHRVRMHDLVVTEAKALHERTAAVLHEDLEGVRLTGDLIRQTSARVIAAAETLMTTTALASYHGGLGPEPWLEASLLLGRDMRGRKWTEFDLSVLPSVLLLYAIGVPAVASGRFDLFGAVMDRNVPRGGGRAIEPFLKLTRPWGFANGGCAQLLIGDDARMKTPISDYLHGVIRPWFAPIVADEDRWSRAFDEFEYLLGLLLQHRRTTDERYRYTNSYYGRFAWNAWGDYADRPDVRTAALTPDTYPPFVAGLFGTDEGQFTTARDELTGIIQRSNISW